MDELEISGKRYISSRRAAKENHYHSDYIGQLIRSGKVIGTKVGRAWYVEEESLGAYFAGEGSLPKTKDTSLSIESISKNISVSLHKTEAPVEKKIFIKTPEEIFAVDEVDTRGIHQSLHEKKEPTLRYIADTEPLFPLAQQTRSQIFDASPLHVPVRSVQEHRVAEPQKINYLGMLVGIFILSGVVCSGILLLSISIASVVTVEQGKPASVGFAFE